MRIVLVKRKAAIAMGIVMYAESIMRGRNAKDPLLVKERKRA